MAKTPTLPPGSNTGKNAGIFQEQGPRGGMRDNFTTVPENRRMPPTSSPGARHFGQPPCAEAWVISCRVRRMGYRSVFGQGTIQTT
jgi:hypothetical protein